jgi:hypothetical protein
MAKRTIFSRPTFSLRRSLRPLTSLVATLCLASGMLIGAVPAYAAANITVTITNLGSFQCAQVLFRGKPLGNTVTTANGTITGPVNGNGMFSINFYSANDCSGKRGSFARFATTTDASYSCDATQPQDTLCTQQ